MNSAAQEWPEEWRRFVYREPEPKPIITLQDIRHRKEVLAELKLLEQRRLEMAKR